MYAIVIINYTLEDFNDRKQTSAVLKRFDLAHSLFLQITVLFSYMLTTTNAAKKFYINVFCVKCNHKLYLYYFYILTLWLNFRFVATYEAGENEILMHHLEVPTLEKFDYYDILKSFSIQADYWLKVQELMPEGHIVIMDLKYITLRIVPKINIFYFQKFLLFLLVSS